MKYIVLLISVLFLTSCSKVPSVQERIKTSSDLIASKTYKKKVFKTLDFDLYTVNLMTNETKQCRKLRVYIEGDGLAWISTTRVSSNPTPINPLALKLFLKDASLCKAYIARPCQYTQDLKCEKKYWTSHRYSQEVVSSYVSLLDEVTKKTDTKSYELVGFSGGGAIASILSAKQNNVSFLLTVAGNIDHKHWTSKYGYTPLYGSLNASDFAKDLEKIKQVHLIGEKDNIIDETNFDSYISKFQNTSNVKKIVLQNTSHSKGWEESWEDILENIK